MNKINKLYDDFVGMGLNSHIVGGLSIGMWPAEISKLLYATLEAPKGEVCCIGSHNGGSECVIGLAKEFKKDYEKIFSVDLCFGEYYDLCISRLKYRCPNQEVVKWTMNSCDFGNFYGEFTGYKKSIGLALVDGYHSFKQAILDTEQILPYLKSGGIILYHDCGPEPSKVGLHKFIDIDKIDESEDFYISEALGYLLETYEYLEEFQLPDYPCKHFRETGLTQWKRGTTSPVNSLYALRLK